MWIFAFSQTFSHRSQTQVESWCLQNSISFSGRSSGSPQPCLRVLLLATQSILCGHASLSRCQLKLSYFWCSHSPLLCLFLNTCIYVFVSRRRSCWTHFWTYWWQILPLSASYGYHSCTDLLMLRMVRWISTFEHLWTFGFAKRHYQLIGKVFLHLQTEINDIDTV